MDYLLIDDWPDQSKSASVIPLHAVAFLSPTNPASYSTIKVSMSEKHACTDERYSVKDKALSRMVLLIGKKLQTNGPTYRLYTVQALQCTSFI